jgi:phage terminase small subunit
VIIDVRGTSVELTERHIELYQAMTTLQADTACFKLMGMSTVNAYVYAGGSAKNTDAQYSSSSEILRQPAVRKFMAEMNNCKFAASVMSRDELAAYYSALTRTTMADIVSVYNGPDLVEEESGLIVSGQTFWTLRPLDEMENAGISAVSELVAGRDGLKIKTHSQLQAAKQLAELLGYNKPQQLEVAVTKSLADLYDAFDDED